MNIAPIRMNAPGRIFKMDDNGIVVSDMLTCDSISMSSETYILTLGIIDENYYEFYLFETQKTIRIDHLDAAVLEGTSAEIV